MRDTVWPSLLQSKKLHCDVGVLSLPRFSDNDGNEITEIRDDHYIQSTYADLLMPLVHALNVHKTAEIDVDDVLCVYRDYRSVWDKQTPSSEGVVPLTNLRLAQSLDEIRLSDRARIARFDDSMKNRIPLYEGFERTDSLSEIARSECALVISSFWGSDQERPLEITQRTVRAIRLATSAEVGACTLKYYSPLTWQAYGGGSQLIKTIANPGSTSDEFDASAAEKVRNIYSKLEASVPRELTVAIDRYVAAFDPRTLEDSVIDLAVSLECALLPGLKDELKYRLALRGAYLLSECESPMKVHSILQSLYDVRSSIVHNGCRIDKITSSREGKRFSKLTGTSATPHNFVREVRELTRKILFALVTIRILALSKNGKSSTFFGVA